MPPSDSNNIPIEISEDTKLFELKHVHEVYNKIAPHFSHTRYNPWPGVVESIDSVPVGGLVLDIGCGNGKYLTVRDDLLFVGADTCQPLLEIAFDKTNTDLYRCDCTKLPFKNHIADLTLSIAVIHHLATFNDRLTTKGHTLFFRLEAISELIRCTKPGGRVVIYVWAMEQKENTVGYRRFESSDVLVPWHLQNKYSENETSEVLINYKRYYHVFTRGEVAEIAEHFKHLVIGYDIRFEANNWVLTLLI